MSQVTEYLKGLHTGIQGLNDVLASLGEKQIVIRQSRRKWPWSRNDEA